MAERLGLYTPDNQWHEIKRAGEPCLSQEEIEALQAKVASYEDLMGKIKTGYPSAKVHEHGEFFGGNDLIFGFVSDTHCGSTMERMADLDAAYKIFQQEGVKVVYHAGDVVAGINVYAGQQAELKVWGANNQADYVAAQYPKAEGISTYFITGNHDLSFLKEAGLDIGVLIEKKRNDLIYLDQIEGNVQIAPEVVLRLWHGMGGSAYALSYKGQRLIASLEGGDKPNILLAGHYHQAYYMDHRNIHYLQGGAFERQTLWLKRAGISPSCSAWLVECHINDGSINKFKPQLLKFF